MAKRVLLVNKYYAPSTGGIETAVKQYAEWYRELGYDVTVLCCASGRMLRSREETIEGTRVLRAASLGNILSVPISITFFWHFLAQLLSTNIVHINLQFPSASLALSLTQWLLKGKSVVSYHCDVYRQRNLKKITYIFDRFALRNADLIITGSPALQERSEVLSRINRKISILPYSINMEHVASCLEHSNTTKLPPHFYQNGYCVFFGRLVSYKGTKTLDEAFRALMSRHSPINLVIFGTGPEEARLQKLAKDFPNNVHFINTFISDIEKYNLINSSKLFLFPSIYYSEAFGIAQLDAMACGKPIINCWLETGVNWVAPDKVAAVTIDPSNPEQLAVAIEELQNNEMRSGQLGEAGLARCKDIFSEAAVRNKFNALIRDL